VVALRATVRALRAELDAVWELAAAAAAAGRVADASRRALQVPLVRAVVTPDEVAGTRAAAGATPALAGVPSMVLDLRSDIATTEIVLAKTRAIVATDPPETVLADLPESALLDPKQARGADVIDVSEPAPAPAADTILPTRRTA
jgi:hypothetical protein